MITSSHIGFVLFREDLEQSAEPATQSSEASTAAINSNQYETDFGENPNLGDLIAIAEIFHGEAPDGKYYEITSSYSYYGYSAADNAMQQLVESNFFVKPTDENVEWTSENV